MGPLGRPTHRREDNIKETGWEGVHGLDSFCAEHWSVWGFYEHSKKCREFL